MLICFCFVIPLCDRPLHVQLFVFTECQLFCRCVALHSSQHVLNASPGISHFHPCCLFLKYRRKSTEGVSYFLFALVILGNITYGLSVLVKSPAQGQGESSYVVHHLPWLIGSLGTLLLDLVVSFQLSERVLPVFRSCPKGQSDCWSCCFSDACIRKSNNRFLGKSVLLPIASQSLICISYQRCGQHCFLPHLYHFVLFEGLSGFC